MLPIIAGIVSTLIQNNLPKLAQAVADKGIDYVEDKLGVKLEPEMSQEKIAEIKLRSMQHEEFKIEQDNKNTADARNMQNIASQQDDIFTKRFSLYFASFWSLAAVVFIFAVSFGTIDPVSVRFIDTVLGFLLGTVVSTIINFFYGSSHSSKLKSEKLLESK